MTRNIAIIAAVAANGAIGFKGGIPWDSPEDRAIFARKTAGGVLVCGKTTWENMRLHIHLNPNGRTVVPIYGGNYWREDKSISDLFPVGRPYRLEDVASEFADRNIWICGGARLYAEAMRNPLVTEMHLSLMDCEPEADAFFPWLNLGVNLGTISVGGTQWRLMESKPFEGGTHRVYRRI